MADEQNPFASVLGEVFGQTLDTAPTPEHTAAPAEAPGFASSATALLEGFGISKIEDRDGVRALVEESLEDVGLDATVGSFRFGVLTIDADPATAHLLRFVTQRLLNALTATYPGEVTDLVVRVRRPRRTPRSGGGAATA